MTRKRPDGLPEHVETDTKRLVSGEQITYYRYVFPDGKRRSLGRDRDMALTAARALNERTQTYRDDSHIRSLVSAPNGLAGSFADLADRYVSDATGHLSQRSLGNRQLEISRAKAHFGTTAITKIGTYEIAQYLNPLSPHARKAHRNALLQFWRWAKEEGFTRENPVSDTRNALLREKQRVRHTWDGYLASCEAAPEWLKRTCQVALFSLQRREYLVNLRWDQVNLTDRTMQVRQQKTGVWLRIRMGEDLYQAIRWFHEIQWPERYVQLPPCPFVIHRKPQRLTRPLREAIADGRMHRYQITPGALSHAFQQARDASGYYAHLPPEQRPSFHDLRALGIFALAKAGFPEEYIQALAGHADVAMTRHYMRGHEQVRPVEVEAGLRAKAVDWSAVDWDDRISPTLEIVK